MMLIYLYIWQSGFFTIWRNPLTSWGSISLLVKMISDHSILNFLLAKIVCLKLSANLEVMYTFKLVMMKLLSEFFIIGLVLEILELFHLFRITFILATNYKECTFLEIVARCVGCHLNFKYFIKIIPYLISSGIALWKQILKIKLILYGNIHLIFCYPYMWNLYLCPCLPHDRYLKQLKSGK